MTLYRPPDTKNDEWLEALYKLSEIIEMTQSHGGYDTVNISGDFRFKNLTWY